MSHTNRVIESYKTAGRNVAQRLSERFDPVDGELRREFENLVSLERTIIEMGFDTLTLDEFLEDKQVRPVPTRGEAHPVARTLYGLKYNITDA